MATAVLALAGCVGLLALRDAEYEARARILLAPIAPYDEGLVGTGLLTGTGDPTRDAQTAAATLESHRASAAAARALGLSRGDVDSSVSVEPLRESNVLGVTATAGVVLYALRGDVNVGYAALVGLPAVVGAVVGTGVQRRLSGGSLTLAFAALLAAVGVWLLVG